MSRPDPPGGSRLGSSLRDGWEQIVGSDTILLVCRLALLYFLFKPVGEWYVRVPLLSLAAVGLLSSRLATSRILWSALSLLVVLRVADNWEWVDNHAYLIVYFCLAILCALWTPEPRRTLAGAARLLVGGVFLLAVLWKALLSPDFVDGTFFRATALSDPRFEEFCLLVGDLSPAEHDANLDAVRALKADPTIGVTDPLVEPAALVRAARWSAWSTLVLEALVAVLFLIPERWQRRWVWRLRHLSLVLFAVATYPFATVTGFGWLLVILGVAQTRPSDRRLRTIYLALFAAILVLGLVPWSRVLLPSGA